MKRTIRHITALWLLLTVCSCADFLSTESPSTMPDTKVFSTEGDTYRAVMNIYAVLARNSLYSQRVSLFAPYNNDIEYAKTNATAEDSRRGLWDYTLTSANTETLPMWADLYMGINSANECIAGIENGPLLGATSPETPSAIRQLYGEAKALRALLYLELVRNWGDVPFLTRETRYNDDFYIAPTDRDEILAYLIDDLIDAEPGMFYASEIAEACERMNRGAVQALIARLSLTRGGWALRPNADDVSDPGRMVRPDDYEKYYRIANTYARKLYESGKHSLGLSYKQVFVNEAQKVFPSNDDMLYEVAMAMSYSSYVGHYIGQRIDNSPSFIYGYSNPWFMVTMPYFHSFDSADQRRSVNCTPYTWVWNNTKGRIEQKISDWKNIYIGKWSKLDMKTPQGAGATINTGINFPVLRYTDALLMLAETENELNDGPTDLAREALKTVRRRAFASGLHAEKVDNYVAALTGHDDFFEAVAQERAWEFCGEGIRKYDLIRWNRLRQSLIDLRQKHIDMAVGARTGTGKYKDIPANIYWKLLDDGTLDIVGLDQNMSSAPAGYSTRGWAKEMVSQSGSEYIVNDAVDQWWRPEIYNRDPMVYIYPYPKDVVAESKGMIVNRYGKR